MDVRTLTVAHLARQLSECNQEAEVKVTIGTVPLSIPLETIAIKEDMLGNEIVSLVVNHETFIDMLDYSIELVTRHEEGGRQ